MPGVSRSFLVEFLIDVVPELKCHLIIVLNLGTENVYLENSTFIVQ